MMLAVMMIKQILTTRVRLMVTIYDDDDDDVLCPQCKLWQPHTLLP